MIQRWLEQFVQKRFQTKTADEKGNTETGHLSPKVPNMFLNELNLVQWQMTLENVHCETPDYSNVFKYLDSSRNALPIVMLPASSTVFDTKNSLDIC